MEAPLEWLLTAADRPLQCLPVSDRSGSRLCENRTRALVVPRSRSFWPPSLPELPEYATQTGNREHFLGVRLAASGFSHSLGRYRPLAASVVPLDL